MTALAWVIFAACVLMIWSAVVNKPLTDALRRTFAKKAA